MTRRVLASNSLWQDLQKGIKLWTMLYNNGDVESLVKLQSSSRQESKHTTIFVAIFKVNILG